MDCVKIEIMRGDDFITAHWIAPERKSHFRPPLVQKYFKKGDESESETKKGDIR